MTTCQYCDGTGACGTCQSHGCADCDFTGRCDACGGVDHGAQAAADRSGRCQFVVRSGRDYRVIDADSYCEQWRGGGPTIVYAAWPVYWRYRGQRD